MSYQPPHAPVGSPAHRPFHPILLLVGLAVPSLSALVSLLLVPQFAATFVGFGTELPWISRVFVDAPWLLCPLPILVLLLWSINPRQQRDRDACVLGVIVSMVGIALAVVAMYLPILRLGATV